MSKVTHTLLIDSDGAITTIHDDDLVPLYEQGRVSISRASHVEPTSDGQWEADMSPVDGPKLGPFRTRQAALDSEVAWLQEHVFQQ